MTTYTFKLSRPLKTHNGDVTELTLKEPTARSFVNHGNPFTVMSRTNASGEPDGVIIEYPSNKAMLGVISDMTEPRVDDIILSGIGAGDYLRLRARCTDIILDVVPDQNPT